MSNQYLQKNPPPWRYLTVAGNVQVFDARGQEVKLFDLLDFTCGVTEAFARRDRAEAAKSAEVQAT